MGRMKLQNTPAIRRMPSYLHKLMLLHAEGKEFASTTVLANYMNLDRIIVRKDFELTGITGQPGVGFRTEDLIAAIRTYLGWDTECNATLVGAGSLGSALLGHEEFSEYGMRITSVFDSDPVKIGRIIHSHEVFDIQRMPTILKLLKPKVGIICVGPTDAQKIVDEMISCGVKAFWNFANISLRVPDEIIVQREVIAGGFAVLSAKMKQRGLKDPNSETEEKNMRKIVICMGSSCFARGNEENLRIIENFIEEKKLDTQIELSGKCCVEDCANGPNIIIDDICYHRVNKETLIDLLNEKFNLN
ncbi:MAG: redox-sensing transcriptional repressor Rex [Planctomycetia bacterium]|nr:redox-sensing transcriptional repressor Rex [Planctomycetia bacterium]